MARVKYKTIGTGTFWSPALERDAEYELLEVIEKRAVTGKAVKCVETGEIFDIAVLTKPTDAQMIDQVAASFREIGAWLVANAPDNPVRHRAALRLIRRTIRDNYLADDLDRDVVWIGSADFGARIAFLRDHLTDPGKIEMVQMAADIGAAGGELSKTDAEFIETLGVGLGLPIEGVYDIVVEAVSTAEPQAA